MARGDHLSVRRGWYTHHAIDLGDGYVVQYGRGVSDGVNATVQVSSYETFAKGCPMEVVASPASYEAHEIALRALSCLGERDYHILWNNCEHFVTWCRSGHGQSQQADRFMQTASEVVTKVAVGLVASGAARLALKASSQTLHQSRGQGGNNALADCRGCRPTDCRIHGECARAGAERGETHRSSGWGRYLGRDRGAHRRSGRGGACRWPVGSRRSGRNSALVQETRLKRTGMTHEPLVYINGEYKPLSQANISVLDQGFLLGDGVFDVVSAWQGTIFKLDEHLDRFFQSLQAARLTTTLTRDEWRQAIIETVRRNELHDATIRFIVTRGVAKQVVADPRDYDPTIIIWAAPYVFLADEEKRNSGIRLFISHLRSFTPDTLDPRYKCLDRLHFQLAKIEALEAGYDDVVWLSADGYVSEGPASNVFMVRQGDALHPRTTGVARHYPPDLSRSGPGGGYPGGRGRCHGL